MVVTAAIRQEARTATREATADTPAVAPREVGRHWAVHLHLAGRCHLVEPATAAGITAGGRRAAVRPLPEPARRVGPAQQAVSQQRVTRAAEARAAPRRHRLGQAAAAVITLKVDR